MIEYDDVKRFMEKANQRQFVHRETDNRLVQVPTIDKDTQSKWNLIKQLSVEKKIDDSLDKRLEEYSTPQPASEKDFLLSASEHKPYNPTSMMPCDYSAISENMQKLLSLLGQALLEIPSVDISKNECITPKAKEEITEPTSIYLSRDTLLQPLLEIIDSCR